MDAKMDAKLFGARLKYLREQANLTQKQLADLAGISQRGVSHWEQGLREPSWSNVMALCKALSISCEEFGPSLTEDSVSGNRGPGRPSKHQAAEEQNAEAPRRKRGRPRKKDGNRADKG